MPELALASCHKLKVVPPDSKDIHYLRKVAESYERCEKELAFTEMMDLFNQIEEEHTSAWQKQSKTSFDTDPNPEVGFHMRYFQGLPWLARATLADAEEKLAQSEKQGVPKRREGSMRTFGGSGADRMKTVG